MFGMILGFLLNVFPKLAEKFFDYQVKKATTEAEAFKSAGGLDLEAFKAHLQANLDNNRLKLAQNSWWGAKLIILLVGIPAALHWAAIFLDTIIPPFGSWGIPKLPAPYDTYQWVIVQSFFLVVPVQTGVNAMAQWLNRR